MPREVLLDKQGRIVAVKMKEEFIGIQREISSQGKFQMPSTDFTFSLPNNVTNVDKYVLKNAFSYCSSLTIVDLSSLTTVSGSYAFSECFLGCSSLTIVDLSSLTTVSGSYAFYYALQDCTSLTSVDLSSLTTVSGSGSFKYIFSGCSSLTSVDLSSLTTVSGNNALERIFKKCTSLSNVIFSSLSDISGSRAFYSAFEECINITNISFPALTTNSFGTNINQFENLLYGTRTNKIHTLHFPSNMESTISGLEGYPLFGGTEGYVVLLFDLPATE